MKGILEPLGSCSPFVNVQPCGGWGSQERPRALSAETAFPVLFWVTGPSSTLSIAAVVLGSMQPAEQGVFSRGALCVAAANAPRA